MIHYNYEKDKYEITFNFTISIPAWKRNRKKVQEIVNKINSSNDIFDISKLLRTLDNETRIKEV